MVGYQLHLDEKVPYFGRGLPWHCLGLPWVSQQILPWYMGQVLVRAYLQHFHGHLQVYLDREQKIIGTKITTQGNVGAYISETTEKELRRVLSLCKSLQTSIGFFIIYSLGYLIGWRLSCLVMVAITTVSSLLLLPLPETPYWLIEKDRHEDAQWESYTTLFLSQHKQSRYFQKILAILSRRRHRQSYKRAPRNCWLKGIQEPPFKNIIYWHCYIWAILETLFVCWSHFHSFQAVKLFNPVSLHCPVSG